MEYDIIRRSKPLLEWNRIGLTIGTGAAGRYIRIRRQPVGTDLLVLRVAHKVQGLQPIRGIFGRRENLQRSVPSTRVCDGAAPLLTRFPKTL